MEKYRLVREHKTEESEDFLATVGDVPEVRITQHRLRIAQLRELCPQIAAGGFQRLSLESTDFTSF